jgi:imipenem/basic amino acid-specific outer membrane pore
MKKISLVLSIAAASSLMAASDLAGAFKEGKVSGVVEAMYIQNLNEQSPNQGSPSVGGSLHFETASLYGVSAGVTFNTANQMGMQDKDPAKRAGSLNYDTTNLQEAYLVGQFGKTTAKVGRQELYTPLANVDDDNRVFKQSFTAGVLINTDLPNTTLIGAHVTEMLTRGQTQFRNMAVVAGVDGLAGKNGVTAVAAIYSGIPGLTLQAWDYYGHDMLNAIYLQGDYKTKVGGAELSLGAQYISEKGQGKLKDALHTAGVNNDINANYYGFNAGVGFGAAKASVAYSKTGKDVNAFHSGSLYLPWGGAWVTPFTSTMEEIPVAADTKAWQVRFDYNFDAMVKGLSAMTRYASYDRNEALAAVSRDTGVMFGWLNRDSNELDIDVTYAFAKNTEARVRWAKVDYKSLNGDKPDYTQIRYSLAYKF